MRPRLKLRDLNIWNLGSGSALVLTNVKEYGVEIFQVGSGTLVCFYSDMISKRNRPKNASNNIKVITFMS